MIRGSRAGGLLKNLTSLVNPRSSSTNLSLRSTMTRIGFWPWGSPPPGGFSTTWCHQEHQLDNEECGEGSDMPAKKIWKEADKDIQVVFKFPDPTVFESLPTLNMSTWNYRSSWTSGSSRSQQRLPPCGWVTCSVFRNVFLGHPVTVQHFEVAMQQHLRH